MTFINSTAFRKIRQTVLVKICFQALCKAVVDSVERHRSASRLFHISGPETAQLLRPMTVAVQYTSSLPEAADLRYLTSTKQNNLCTDRLKL